MVRRNDFFASDFSDVSCSYNDIPSPTSYEEGITSEFSNLSKLSTCLEKLVLSNEYDYNDAEIEVEGITVGVNRGILAARSQHFHEIFRHANDCAAKTDRPKYLMSDLVPYGRIGYEAFMVVLYFLYTGKVKESPAEVSTCIDESCAHDACRPAIDFVVQLMYASVNFQIKELAVAIQRRLIDFVDKACVEDVVPILIVAFHCKLKQLLSLGVPRIAQSNLENILIEKELPLEISADIKSLGIKSLKSTDENSVNEKNVKKIHKALDSNDVELVKLLLRESEVTLDAACALHYAAAYCNPKTLTGLLSLEKADINLRNARGYTVLHIAARRKDPSIVIELLHRGASVSDSTPDGQTSLTICKRLTRPKDFTQEMKRGLNTNKDRLCIAMLEIKTCSNPPTGNVSDSAKMAADDLRMGLLNLENRVAMARQFFPLEASLAMQVAEADSTTEFPGPWTSQDSHTPELFDRLQQRLRALKRTVETGRRFFPNCSEVLDRQTEDETLGHLILDKGTPEERTMKRARFVEILQDVSQN